MTGLSATEVAELRTLLAERACRTLIERYGYAVDWMNWPGLEALFWPEARLDYGMWSGTRDEAVAWVAALEAGYQRRLHMLGIPRIEMLGETGRAEAAAVSFVRAAADDGTTREDMVFVRYQFGFEARDGEWRMSSLRFLIHGVQGFTANDQGGAPFFADGFTPDHPYFAQ